MKLGKPKVQAHSSSLCVSCLESVLFTHVNKLGLLHSFPWPGIQRTEWGIADDQTELLEAQTEDVLNDG